MIGWIVEALSSAGGADLGTRLVRRGNLRRNRRRLRAGEPITIHGYLKSSTLPPHDQGDGFVRIEPNQISRWSKYDSGPRREWSIFDQGSTPRLITRVPRFKFARLGARAAVAFSSNEPGKATLQVSLEYIPHLLSQKDDQAVVGQLEGKPECRRDDARAVAPDGQPRPHG